MEEESAVRVDWNPFEENVSQEKGSEVRWFGSGENKCF